MVRMKMRQSHVFQILNRSAHDAEALKYATARINQYSGAAIDPAKITGTRTFTVRNRAAGPPNLNDDTVLIAAIANVSGRGQRARVGLEDGDNRRGKTAKSIHALAHSHQFPTIIEPGTRASAPSALGRTRPSRNKRIAIALKLDERRNGC